MPTEKCDFCCGPDSLQVPSFGSPERAVRPMENSENLRGPNSLRTPSLGLMFPPSQSPAGVRPTENSEILRAPDSPPRGPLFWTLAPRLLPQGFRPMDNSEILRGSDSLRVPAFGPISPQSGSGQRRFPKLFLCLTPCGSRFLSPCSAYPLPRGGRSNGEF